ncbi:MAG: ABC transporter permease [Candidatus Izemoplasmatales bacterium]
MILQMVKRNLRSYFRDTSNVFFSMLGVIIIIGLYMTFLGNMITGVVSDLAGDQARFLMDSWIMGGVVAASTVTTTLGAFGIMVDDREKKTVRDFLSSPMKRSSLVLSYILSAMVIGLFMSLFTFVLAEIYIVLHGSILPFVSILKVLGIIILNVAASSAMAFFLLSFIKSSNAMTALSIVVGTIIGFLTGIYIPMGNLNEGLQTIIKFFPPSHAAVLLRQVMMDHAMSLDTLPSEVLRFLGVQFEIGGNVVSGWIHLLFLVATFLIFYAMSILLVSKRKEKE